MKIPKGHGEVSHQSYSPSGPNSVLRWRLMRAQAILALEPPADSSSQISRNALGRAVSTFLQESRLGTASSEGSSSSRPRSDGAQVRSSRSLDDNQKADMERVRKAQKARERASLKKRQEVG